jgi:selenocysteine lyase/cysteine desulfurase
LGKRLLLQILSQSGKFSTQQRQFSFYIDDAHYNLIVNLLNDRFGIQTRGGCSCAGTYGHFLLHVNELTSKAIEQKILEGCLMERPGWVRMSIHPTMTTVEVDFICDAIEKVAANYNIWGKDYIQNSIKNEFEHKEGNLQEQQLVNSWFKS